jgi:hypothetical protein
MRQMLLLFSALFLTASYAEQNNNSEDWVCEEQINRTGTFTLFRCTNSKRKIACYEDVHETCTERDTNRTSTRDYIRFTGECVAHYSECE